MASPNGKYLALEYTVYSVSIVYVTNPLSPVAIAATAFTGINPYAVAWSPNSQYIAVANNGSNNVSLCDVTNPYSPITIATANVGTSPYALAWSPNGQYLAVANNGNNTISLLNV